MTPTLTDSPAQIIRQALIDLALGTVEDTWPVFATSEPSGPDNVITVYDTQGTDDGRSMVDGELYTHHGFQVRVRSKEHPAGWLKADAIRAELSKVHLRTVVISGEYYLLQAITRIGNVMVLGKEADKSKRSLFTVNATVPIRALT